MKKFIILIIGGSQGARKFDNLFSRDLIKLSKKIDIKIFHQTSIKNINNLKKLFIKQNKFFMFFHTLIIYKIIKKRFCNHKIWSSHN